MMTAVPRPRSFPDVLGERADVLHAYRMSHPAKQPIRLHPPGAKHWTLLYTVSGQCTLELHGADLTTRPGNMLIFRRDEYTRGKPIQGAKWECLHICFEVGADWSPPPTFRRLAERLYSADIQQPSTRQHIRDAYGRMLAHAQIRFAARAVSQVNAAPNGAAHVDGEIRHQLVLMALREMLLLAEDDLAGLSRLDARVREALEIMGTDLTSPHSLRSLGRSCHLSPSRFAQLFREELGISPIRALRRMRLRQAALDLQYTDDSVERIAEATGFTSISHLSREFRREFGVSPRTYRAKVGF